MNPDLCSQPNLTISDQPSEISLPKTSFLHKVQAAVARPEISQEVIESHHKLLTKIQQIGIIAQAIDKKEFREQEFILFSNLKNHLFNGVDEYEGLNRSLRLFRVAIGGQNSFLTIEQIELIYRSTSQQEFYDLVFELLSRNVSTSYFYQKVHEKFIEVLPQIRTRKGKKALHAYMQALDQLAKQDKLGLKLLFLFKKHQLTDYSILKTVSDIILALQSNNLRDLNSFIQMVNMYYPLFEQLGKIIGVPTARSNAKTYALMLQYLALRYKYKKSYIQFDKMIKILKDWQKSYLAIQDIRQKYPVFKYKQPPEFKTKLQGTDVYQYYKSYLI